MSTGDPIARPDALGVAALGAIAFALCDSLHELGHLLAAVLPEQGSVISISSVDVSTTTSRPRCCYRGTLGQRAARRSRPLHQRYRSTSAERAGFRCPLGLSTFPRSALPIPAVLRSF